MKSRGIGYRDPNRLADVMALIQVLARGQKAYKSEQGLLAELQGFPKPKPSNSKLSWIQLAQQHPEFFRVRGPHGEFKEDSVSLISRHVFAEDSGRSA